MTALRLSRNQVLAHRRRAGQLDERLPATPSSLRAAGWVGLQDSMPRAALLSIHARVEGTTPDSWADPAFVQLWGPRFQAYVVPAIDHPLFSVSRYPDDAKGQAVAEKMAAMLHEHLAGRRMRYGDAGTELGVHGNSFRYGAATGTILIRWEGARQPVVWTVPRPDITPDDARDEIARRYVHVFGPTTADSFAKWLGIGAAQARSAFARLGRELLAARTDIGDGVILEADEPSFTSQSKAAPTAARFLPSGDAFWLLWGRDRALLVPDEQRRDELWTSRVWPGALLVDGELTGTWRRADEKVDVDAWRRMTPAERAAVEAEAASMPLPNLVRPIEVRWSRPEPS
ncbi:MAG TPA: crosslink repair DNA glycosylase YcaQ family protein [Candidatus Limnocylindrales bacterium]|nr:crosslink repair DNA glycosylase YcaQ family protein [Candidatus Limnocylindrales bacterium]